MIAFGETGVSVIRRVVAATVLVGALLGAHPAPAQAQDLVRDTGAPSLANVKDVTGGMNYLLQDDDLVMLQVDKNGKSTSTSVVTLNTTGSKITGSRKTELATSLPSDSFDLNAGATASEAVGRMYATQSDIVALLAAVNNAASSDAWSLTLFDPRSGYKGTTTLSSIFRPRGTVYTKVLMGDFNGDNLVDPLVFYLNSISSRDSEWGMKVLTAADPQKEGPPTEGPELSGNNFQMEPLVDTIVVGDFAGNGRDQIAALLDDYHTVVLYSVDPKSLLITETKRIPLDVAIAEPDENATFQVSMKPGQVALTAGRFRNPNPPNADLVVFGQIDKLQNVGGGSTKAANGYSIIPIFINVNPQDGSMTETVTPKSQGANGLEPFFRFPDYHGASGALAQAAQLVNWPQQTQQQLVLGIQTRESASYIQIGNFTQDLGTFLWYSKTERNAGLLDVLANMWVGNFNHLNSDGSYSPLQQIQTEEYVTSLNTEARIFIFDVNVPSPLPPEVTKQTDWLKQKSDYGTGIIVDVFTPIPLRQDVLVPGDTQGRSLRLGTPTIVHINTQLQPDLILATPPMHVDYIATRVDNFPGCPDSTKPCVANVSVRPVVNQPGADNLPFASSFAFSESTTNASAQSTTTGWGIATKVTVGAKFTFNDGFENASGSIQDTTRTAHDENVKRAWSNYTSKTQKGTETTGLTDRVFYSQRGMNVYYYPVLGCEDEGSKCFKDGHNEPLFVDFSVPDVPSSTDQDGNTQDWYQPVHEPGNVLSYPWDQTKQLQYQFTGELNPLTKASTACTGIGSGFSSATTSWAQGNNMSQTSGSSSTFSNELSMSYSEGAGVAGVDNADVSFNASVAANTSLFTNNVSSTSLMESGGFTLTIPAFPTAECCGYGFSQIIFGLKNKNYSASERACAPGENPVTSGCTVVNDPGGKVPIQVVGTGPMFTGYSADPIGGGNSEQGCANAPAFWQNVYTQPDVALNHPNRWRWDPSSLKATFNSADQTGTEALQQNLFYLMKGFFVTKDDGTSSGPLMLPDSPNLVEAVADEGLILTTRVYNYSLVKTTNTVYVRFYGQRYCVGDVCGDSFQIGQDQTIASIPGFRSDAVNDSPNWSTSSVKFKPTDYSATKNGGVSMVFWVVVWMQDATGHLVAEMPDHGLSSIPSKATTQIIGEPIEQHSNNVGAYGLHQPFHILPVGTPSAATPGNGSLASIALSANSQVLLDQPTPLLATLQAKGAAVRSITIAYYDGDQSKSGSLVDAQNITALEPGVNYTHRALFTPRTCGLHTLYASAWLPTSPNLNTSTTVNVTLEPQGQIQAMLDFLQSAKFTDQQKLGELTALLNVANQAYQQGQTETAETLLGMYIQEVTAMGGTAVSKQDAQLLISQASVLFGCGSSGFALSVLTNSATVSSGADATYAFAVTPSGGFKGAVSLTCTGAPQGSTCSVSSPSVTLDGVSQSPLTVTITTTAGGSAMAGMIGAWPGAVRSGGVKWILLVFASLFVMASLRRARLSSSLVAFAVALILLGGTVGCGSGSSSSGTATPAGNYTLTVQGTSGSVMESTKIILNVK